MSRTVAVTLASVVHPSVNSFVTNCQPLNSWKGSSLLCHISRDKFSTLQYESNFYSHLDQISVADLENSRKPHKNNVIPMLKQCNWYKETNSRIQWSQRRKYPAESWTPPHKGRSVWTRIWHCQSRTRSHRRGGQNNEVKCTVKSNSSEQKRSLRGQSEKSPQRLVGCMVTR